MSPVARANMPPPLPSKMAQLMPQLAATFVANMGPLLFGVHIAWLTCLPEHAVLGRTLTVDEISWIATLPLLATLVGMPVFGWVLQHTSRRTALILPMLLHAAVFTALALIPTVLVTMIARFIAGIAGAGSFITTPIYVGECVDDARRGTLGGATGFFITVGVAGSFVLGTFCPYMVFNLVCLVFPAIFLVSFWWLPESPVYLLARGDAEGAERSLSSLRGGCSVESELASMGAVLSLVKQADSPGLCETLSNRTVRRALLIIIVIMSSQQLCGSTAINVYMAHIVYETSPGYEEVALTVLGVVQVVASAAGPLLLSFAGRRKVLVASGWVMTAALGVLAGSCRWMEPTVVNVTALAVYTAAYTVGLGTVPFVLLPELLPPWARGVATGTVGVLVGALASAVTKLYPHAVDYITLPGCFFSFGLASFFATLFFHFGMFETRGLTSQEIFRTLQGNKNKQIVVAISQV